MSGRRAAAVVTIVLAATGLTGCGAVTSDISVSTSELLQSMVVSTADQAAAGDAAGATSTLDALQSQLDQALSTGEVSTERASRIQEAIDLVRADLQPAPLVTPEPTDSSAPAESVSPTVTEAPATTVDPGSNGNGNNGGGKGNNGNNGNGNNGRGDGKNGNGKN